MTWLALALAVLSGMTFAEDSPSAFAFVLPLETTAPAPFYEVELPQAVYEGVVRKDLGDLRVVNTAGEVVPHALLPRAAPAAQAGFLAPPLFPLRGDVGSSAEQLGLRIQMGADGAIVSISPTARAVPVRAQYLLGYIADLSSHRGALRAVELEPLASLDSFTANLRLEASDDLAHWRVLVGEAPVLRLASGGQRLERLRVEFPPQGFKYLRVLWASKSDAPELSALRVELAQAAEPSRRHWIALSASLSDHGTPNEYRFELGGPFPADRLQVGLPESNTVVAVEILTREASSESWRRLAHATVYRLRQGEEDVESPSIVLNARPQRELLLRVDPKGGGIGRGSPTLHIGWVAQRLVFVARGEGPFRLAYGSRSALPSAYSVEALVPGYGAEAEAGQVARPAILPARPGTPGVLAGAAATREHIDFKRVLLWGMLALGVAVLGAMTWRLWRQVGQSAGGTQAAGDGRSNSEGGPA